MTEMQPRPSTRRPRARGAQRTDEGTRSAVSSAVIDDGSAAPDVPFEDAIRIKAYELYLARGGAPGHELEDWLAAERALRETPANGPAPERSATP
jgi:hypothetical protein